MPPPPPHSSHVSNNASNTFRFPSLPHDTIDERDEYAIAEDESSDRGIIPAARVNGGPREGRWGPRKASSSVYAQPPPFTGPRRGRQKSLSEALRNIHNRRGSVSENAHEIAEALKAPVSLKLMLLCGFWYMTSIFSNASSKSILTAFRKPITLTLVQFFFTCSLCLFSSILARRYPSLPHRIPVLKHPIQRPSKDLIATTLPLTVFQIGGHILNSDAMSRVPVSLVHTIKGLSPLFTVLAYRLFFRIHYTVPTYLSLVPLTAGVVMACSAGLSSNFAGLLGAFGSAVLFVTQNIVSKRLFNEAEKSENDGTQRVTPARKPDKLNLLFYSSALAFAFTLPIQLWSETPSIVQDLVNKGSLKLAERPDALDHGRLALEFVFNGIFHFAQSLVAFVLLSMVSPVTYSVASLIKRVFVITFSIAWFGNPMTKIQAFGIGMTFVGLYLYDRTNDAARAERFAKLQQNRSEAPLLPLIQEEKKVDLPARIPSPLDLSEPLDMSDQRVPPMPITPGLTLNPEDLKLNRAAVFGQNSGESGSPLRPGTKQEETWNDDDRGKSNGEAR